MINSEPFKKIRHLYSTLENDLLIKKTEDSLSEI